MRRKAKAKRVVRLKGGDPFIFGRGGEELQAAAEAGIPFQVVPGITAASGATAYAGIPLTHRDYAQSVTFVTGHYKADSAPFDWAHLAQSRQTLAIYMGTMKAADISEQLIAHGREATTPVAVISRGTRADQQVATGTLEQLEEPWRKPRRCPPCSWWAKWCSCTASSPGSSIQPQRKALAPP